jgi:hypothetical protein
VSVFGRPPSTCGGQEQVNLITPVFLPTEQPSVTSNVMTYWMFCTRQRPTVHSSQQQEEQRARAHKQDSAVPSDRL